MIGSGASGTRMFAEQAITAWARTHAAQLLDGSSRRRLRKLKAHWAAAEGHTLERAEGGNSRFHSIKVDEADEQLEALWLGAALDASYDDVPERAEHLHKVTFSDN